MSTKLQIVLPNPHPKQGEVIGSLAKRKILVTGRRWGKTTCISVMATEKMLAHRRELYLAPTQEQTDALWSACKHYLAPAVSAGIIYKNETQRVLELTTGGRIRAKTAWNADTARGDYADDLYLDEFALMDPSVWDEVGAPMLLDNDGDATFIFTPKRRNHAYRMYQTAISASEPDEQQEQNRPRRWQVWHGTSLDNPYLSQEALVEITRDMTENAYRQEILAEFLEDQGAVFRNVRTNATLNKSSPEMHDGHIVVIGADWGQRADYTVLKAICSNCQQEVDSDRFNQISWDLQRARLMTMARKWSHAGHPASILPERNSIGSPNIEALILEGMNVLPGHDGLPGFDTTMITKPPLIKGLVLAFERSKIKIIADEVTIGELEAYEEKESADTTKPKFSAPPGMHDDTVMALALALKAAKGSAIADKWIESLTQEAAPQPAEGVTLEVVKDSDLARVLNVPQIGVPLGKQTPSNRRP